MQLTKEKCYGCDLQDQMVHFLYDFKPFSADSYKIVFNSMMNTYKNDCDKLFEWKINKWIMKAILIRFRQG
jgi:hypothetical protein